jgi:predicted nucleotidyltransferase
MLGIKRSDFESLLISSRETILEKILELFQNIAVEGHIFGSLARGNSDAYSDIDIWFTFKDEDFDEIYKKRFEYYANFGDIIHSCEAPQNAPINGVHTALLIRSHDGVISVIDICLCPLSTAYMIGEGKKLFGIDLPAGVIGYNPKKAVVDKDYRIDFLICFIFSAIKKLARNQSEPLKALFEEYQYLRDRYGIVIEPLIDMSQDLDSLKKIIENVSNVSNKRQQKTLSVIDHFLGDIEINCALRLG